MLTISIILNVVLGYLVFIIYKSNKRFYKHLETSDGKVNALGEHIRTLYKLINDAQLEYQGIKDQFYKERGES